MKAVSPMAGADVPRKVTCAKGLGRVTKRVDGGERASRAEL